MLRFTKRRTFLVFIICMLSALVDSAMSAGLQCDTVWPGPSSDNDVGKCLTTFTISRFSGPSYVFVVINALLLILFLLIFPIIFLCCVCCQCCCACCKEVPSGSRSESKNSRKNLVILMVILLGIGVTVIALIITGCTQLRSGAEDVFTNFKIHIVDYFLNIISELRAATYDSDTGSYTEPFSNSTFDNIRDQITSLQNTTDKYHGDVINYSELAANVGYALAVFPLFLFSFTFLFAFLNCRSVLPSLLTCVYYLVGIVFALVAVVMLLMGAIFGDVCAEIDLQKTRQPGLFQWYVVPVCENTANFTAYKEQINSMEADFAKQFCEEMSNYCSATTVYNPSTPSDVFYCTTTNATAATDCPNFGNATVILNAAFAKTGSGVCGASNCSFRQCPTQCVDTQLQSKASDALTILDSANRIFNALDLVLPLMSCNAVVDIVLHLMDSCPSMRDGFTNTGVAFFLTLIGIVFAWIVMFRGQKVWFSQQDYDDDVKPSYPAAGNMEEQLLVMQQQGGALSFPHQQHVVVGAYGDYGKSAYEMQQPQMMMMIDPQHHQNVEYAHAAQQQQPIFVAQACQSVNSQPYYYTSAAPQAKVELEDESL